MICKTPHERDALLTYLQQNGILAIFHYLPLHMSAFYAPKYKGSSLPMAQKYADQLVRLPLFYTLTEIEQQYIIDKVNAFYAYK
jgi:dTDP-4-amino-4,6-dideoxygalactose transaminase